MFKNSLYLILAVVGLVGCGNGNDSNQNMYGYNANGGVCQMGPAPAVNTFAFGGGRHRGQMCPSQVAADWNCLIASQCNLGDQPSQAQAQACDYGAKQFQQRYPGINCDIAVDDLQWCPGDRWRSQKTFTINDFIIQSIYDKYGWAAQQQQPGYYPGYPNNNGNYNGGYYPQQPGYSQQPGYPGHY